MQETLSKIGLTNSEIKIFKELCSLPAAPVSLIAQKTGLYRTNIYDTLKKMVEKGLVSSILRNNQLYFSITEPKNLLLLLENKKKELDETETEINSFIEQIKKRIMIKFMKKKKIL